MQFDEVAIAKDQQSWFMFLYSDSNYIAGDIKVQPDNDDIPVPDKPVPEPTTLALLGFGTILSLRRRK